MAMCVSIKQISFIVNWLIAFIQIQNVSDIRKYYSKILF
jgi:hypothetical protein